MSDAADFAAFYFDDFFETEEQRTVTIPVTIRGRVVPITIKAGLSAADRLASQSAAVQKVVKPNGQVNITGIDESAATLELIFRALVAWPFTQKNGSPIPITKPNILRLLGGVDAIAEALQKLDEGGEGAVAPFAPPSVAD